MLNKILIINPFGIGDVIVSMGLVEAIKKSLPQTRVGFLGNERTLELLRMNRSIDVCHEFNRDWLREGRQKSPWSYFSRASHYLSEIRRQKYDAVVDLSLGREFGFSAFLLGIPVRIGFDYKHRGAFLTHRTRFDSYAGKSVGEHQLSLIKHLGLEPPHVSSRLPLLISPAAQAEAVEWLRKNDTDNTKIYAVAPGGGKSWGPNASYKQWSPANFARTMDRWILDHPGTVLLLGDREEGPLLSKVSALSKSRNIIADGHSLPVVCALLSRSEFLLCNDGGLMHLANALGVKTVALFGPVDEKVYGPSGVATPHQVLTEEVPCRPCYQRFHFPPCAHQRRCLEELSPQKVLAALQKIS